MHADCAAAWKVAEDARERLVRRVAALPTEAQTQRPNPRSFAATEVLEHMALTEALYLPWFLPSAERRPGRPNFLLGYLVRRMRSGRRTPTVKMLEPRVMPTLQEASEHWGRVRAQMEEQMAGASPEDVVLKHPLFGRMRVRDLAELLDSHTEYHDKRLAG